MPHQIPFEILLWGSRSFVYQPGPSRCQGDEGALIYREGAALPLQRRDHVEERPPMKTRPGPATTTASARLPDGRLAVMIGLQSGATQAFDEGKTLFLEVPMPDASGPPLLLLIRVHESDPATFMEEARATFTAAADGDLQPTAPLQIYPKPADTDR